MNIEKNTYITSHCNVQLYYTIKAVRDRARWGETGRDSERQGEAMSGRERWGERHNIYVCMHARACVCACVRVLYTNIFSCISAHFRKETKAKVEIHRHIPLNKRTFKVTDIYTNGQLEKTMQMTKRQKIKGGIVTGFSCRTNLGWIPSTLTHSTPSSHNIFLPFLI